MIQQAKKTFNLISNMGLRYVFFRVIFSLKTKIGWQKKIFPTNPEPKKLHKFRDIGGKTHSPFSFMEKKLLV